MEKVTFGAGCFWHVEEEFRQVAGVTATQVGYMGGTKEHPTYEEVCSHTTGHAEVVEVTYDPGRVSYDELLRVFWDCHPAEPAGAGRREQLPVGDLLAYPGAGGGGPEVAGGGGALGEAPASHCHRDHTGHNLLAGGGIPPAVSGEAGYRLLPLVAHSSRIKRT